MVQRCVWLVLLASVLFPPAAAAQGPPDVPSWDGSGQIVMTRVPPSTSPFSSLFPAVAVTPTLSLGTLQQPTRACDACPKRRPLVGFFEALGVNVVFNLTARFRKENDVYKVTPSSWWANLQHGFEWDDSAFKVNQFGHPYQGGLYFNSGRANGLGFWESASLAAFGSATWEFFGETNYASINDLVTTTVGGMALGEMLYRAGWLIRDTRLSGRPRLWREIFATIVDPVTGVNRFMSGDASRVSENPPHLKPTALVGDFDVGVQWTGELNRRAVNSAGDVFAELRLGYSDIFSSPYKDPYDAFSVALRFGGGSSISYANIRGRLYGRFLGGGPERRTEFLVAQGYDYEDNPVFQHGGQSVVTGLSHRFRPSGSVDVAVWGLGGPILLAALTSPLAQPTEPVEGEAPPRTWDFGPGAVVGAGALVRVGGFPVVRVTYGGFYIHTLSAVAETHADHYAQVLRVGLLAPLWRNLRLGVSGDYLRRSAYYETIPDVHQWVPQFRVFLAKVSR